MQYLDYLDIRIKINGLLTLKYNIFSIEIFMMRVKGPLIIRKIIKIISNLPLSKNFGKTKKNSTFDFLSKQH